MTMYCGNNRLAIGPGDVLGTRHGCMKKGIGVGLNMPYDPSFIMDYDPIDTTVIYCGNEETLPSGYDRFGSLPNCLQKGVGIGKRMVAKDYEKHGNYKVLKIAILVIVITILFSILYFPPWLKNKSGKMNWLLFIGIFVPLVVFIVIIFSRKYR